MNDLKKLAQLEKIATDFGFAWEKAEQIIEQIKSEITEVEVHLVDGNTKKCQEEIGDLLHAVFSLCVFCDFDAEQTLANSINKFERRLSAVQQLAKEQGLKNLNGKSFDELMQFWKMAKIMTEK